MVGLVLTVISAWHAPISDHAYHHHHHQPLSCHQRKEQLPTTQWQWHSVSLENRQHNIHACMPSVSFLLYPISLGTGFCLPLSHLPTHSFSSLLLSHSPIYIFYCICPFSPRRKKPITCNLSFPSVSLYHPSSPSFPIKCPRPSVLSYMPILSHLSLPMQVNPSPSPFFCMKSLFLSLSHL